MAEQKEPKDMNLGELIIDLVRTERKIIQLEHDLDPVVLDEFWRNSPYPENKESSVQRTRKEYESYKGRFTSLQEELNQREQLYSKK